MWMCSSAFGIRLRNPSVSAVSCAPPKAAPFPSSRQGPSVGRIRKARVTGKQEEERHPYSPNLVEPDFGHLRVGRSSTPLAHPLEGEDRCTYALRSLFEAHGALEGAALLRLWTEAYARGAHSTSIL